MNKTISIIIALAILGAGYWMYATGTQSVPPTPAEPQVPASATALDAAAPAPVGDATPAAAPAPSEPEPTAGTGVSAAAAAGIAMAEVAKHDTKDDCWVVLFGKVYDVTASISQHPGGEQAIMNQCGKDGSATFQKQSQHAKVGALKALAPSMKGDLAL